jgi:hypothetical protein
LRSSLRGRIASPGHDYDAPMTRRFVPFTLLLVPCLAAADLPLDVTKHGIVYRDPGMRRVVVRKDVKLEGAPPFNLYLPAKKRAAKLPVVVFVNGVGDFDPENKLKDWKIYEDGGASSPRAATPR